jgi:hypothetical protein
VHGLEQIRTRQPLVRSQRIGAGEVDVLLGVARRRVPAAEEDLFRREGRFARRVADAA